MKEYSGCIGLYRYSTPNDGESSGKMENEMEAGFILGLCKGIWGPKTPPAMRYLLLLMMMMVHQTLNP